MKPKTIGLSIAIVFLLAAASFGADVKMSDAPLAVVLESVYKFNPVLDGEEIVHDFVIQNRGTAELKIYKVETG